MYVYVIYTCMLYIYIYMIAEQMLILCDAMLL